MPPPLPNANGKRPAEDNLTKSSKTVTTRFRECIKVYVGSQSESLVVHQEPICERSEFFKARCSEPWTSSMHNSPRGVDLREHDIDTFSLYLESLHGHSADLATQARAMEKENNGIHVDGAVLEMHPTCKKVVVDTIIDKGYFNTPNADINVYEAVYTTRQGSGLRKLLIDSVLYDGCSVLANSFAHWNAIPVEMAQDLAIKALREWSTNPPGQMGATEYYD